ncbi:MAG: DUF4411 family protein [Melioribacteraceae bacterium]|jgi:hypothetical protein|nr:DUF4411 family protein [Melioribacteraceae bacterium]
MAIYVVDSNFFIQAHRAIYPLDVAITFWEKVKQLAIDGKIVSIDKVKNELYDKNDELELWCKDNLPSDFFKSSDESIPSYIQVAEWASSRSDHYLEKAINEFLDADEADAFLIAFVLSDNGNRILVTHEKSAPQKKGRIKIPDVCDSLGVRTFKTIDMFRDLGETF